jgi:hypothetical protein
LVLSFLPRVESKASVVLAIDTAMVAFLAANAPPFKSFSICLWVSSGLTVALVATSIVMLYRCSFPNLKGGHSSLVYFREIAKRTEHRFVKEFAEQTSQDYANDLLTQAHRNSEILSIKFNALKWAFALMALGIIPWIISLVWFAAIYGGSHPIALKP